MRRNNWKAKILALIGILVGILAGGAAAWAAWKYAGAQYVERRKKRGKNR